MYLLGTDRQVVTTPAMITVRVDGYTCIPMHPTAREA